MKYILKGIYFTLVFIIFVIAVIVQFLWSLKRPTVTLDKTFDNGQEILNSFRDDDGGYYDGY
jgi:hypothetical protein